MSSTPISFEAYWPVHLDPKVHRYPNVNLTLLQLNRIEEGLRLNFLGNDTGSIIGHQDAALILHWDGTCKFEGSQHQWMVDLPHDNLGFDLEYEPYHVDSLEELLGAPLRVQEMAPEIHRQLPDFLAETVVMFLKSAKIHRSYWDGISGNLLERGHVFDLFRGPIPPEAPELIQEVNAGLLKYLALHPEALHEIHPRVFEEIVAELFERLGFTIELTRYQRDGGRDIIGVRRNSVGDLDRYLIECKRYRPQRRVGVDLVRQVIGLHDIDPATRYCIVTTSTFTKGAKELERKLWFRLSLRDYNDIVAWLKNA